MSTASTPGLATRPLGRAALEVTVIGFGGAAPGNFGQARSDEEAAAALAAAWDGGIRYFDTAPHYGLGLSERRVGAALRDHPRSEFVLSTKVGRLLEPNPAPTGSDLAVGGFDVPDDRQRVRDYSADGVRRSLDASLERLGADRIDIVLVHDPDDHVDQAVTEAIPALVSLREQGVVGAVGVGMNQWPAPLRAVDETDVDVVMIAGRWTLADRTARPLLDRCAERGVAVLAAAPFNSGLLARPHPATDATFNYEPAPRPMLERARALADVCDSAGISLPQAALQFPLRHPAVASVVVGLSTGPEVDAAIEHLRVPIDDEVWARLDAVVHGRR
ncbi:MAG TPA: aldo/keto reductase [Streptosporangiaceae bacterium]|nr:aldo/keto reductase [Streptosporangiaceae bacterium]